MASSTVEDYLKQLYLQQHAAGETEAVPTGRLAAAMSVTPGTATSMLKALANSGLVEHGARRGARLTPQGEQLALHVLRRHRLMELFLVQVLGLDWSVVHEEADLLEHAVSDRVLEAIDVLLDHPPVDPHGDPIPGQAGYVEAAACVSLADCPIGTPLRISRILNQDEAFLRFVERTGLVPGALVVAESREPATDAVRVRGKLDEAIALGTAAAAKILVDVRPGALPLDPAGGQRPRPAGLTALLPAGARQSSRVSSA